MAEMPQRKLIGSAYCRIASAAELGREQRGKR